MVCRNFYFANVCFVQIIYKLFDFEKYLLNCNYVERIALSKLRCANIKLPVYNTIFMYDTDICTLCNLYILGDEYHYIMLCPYFREKYVKPYYYTRPSVIKFEKLLCSSSKKKLSNLAKFARIILKQFWMPCFIYTYSKYILYLATVCTNDSILIVILQVYYLY